MKVLFFIQSLIGGGAERVTAVVANGLASRGHQVYIITMTDKTETYPLNSLITHINIDKKNKEQTLRNIIKDIHPDVCIAVMYHYFTFVLNSVRGLNIPVIISDHNNFHYNPTEKRRLTRFHLYNLANKVTVLTKADEKYMSQYLHNMKVMYNPLSFPRLNEEVKKRKVVLCVGRLNSWEIKGFDRMIRMWGKISKSYPGWTLEIAGTGKDESLQYLKDLAKKEKVDKSVYFLGWRTDIQEIMKSAAVFALPSREEGFPCVLLEAMSQGCAPVAFEIHGNIKEIITNGVDGYVVPDDDEYSFVERLKILMSSEKNRVNIGRSAIESMKRFEPDVIVDQWESLLQEVVNKKK